MAEWPGLLVQGEMIKTEPLEKERRECDLASLLSILRAESYMGLSQELHRPRKKDEAGAFCTERLDRHHIFILFI